MCTLALWDRVAVVVVCMLVLCRTCHGQQGQFVNVARNKNCSVCSTWEGPPWNPRPPRDVNLAVDGQIDESDDGSQCVHTSYHDFDSDNSDYTCYWQVDLGASYSIHRMVSYGRNTFYRRMATIEVTVDGQLCYTYPSNFNSRKNVFTCTDGVRTGSRVRLSKTSTENVNGDYAINLCEFEVLTCKDGYWGAECNINCGSCSTDSPFCDKVTGACQSCQPGWKPSVPNRCIQACDDGTYGQNCALQCSSHCSDVCDKVNGHCTCQPGYLPPTCVTMCADGRYGQDCRESCGQGCSSTCNKVNGECSCSSGWQPPLCNTECPNGQYGQNCQQTCSAFCSNVCDKVFGNCNCQPGYLPPFCLGECSPGQYGQDCGERCSDNCADVCDHVTGHCSCRPGWRGSKCDQKCQGGTYGQDCSLRCGKCQGGADCDHVTGQCAQCQQYFSMPMCTDCVDYKFGSNCQSDCSQNCQDVCETAQGHCTCIAGWREPDCVNECRGGTYGLRCLSQCGNCSDGRTSCDHVTGHCPSGCEPGLAAPLCQMALLDDGGGGGRGSTGVIVGAVVGVVAITAVVVVINGLIIPRRGLKAGSRKEETLEPSSAISNGDSSNSISSSNNNLLHQGKRKTASLSNRDNIYQNVTLTPQAASINEDPTDARSKGKPVVAVKPKLKAKPSPPASDSAAIYQNSAALDEVHPQLAHHNRSSAASKPPPPPPTHQDAETGGDAEDADDESTRCDVYYNDDTYMTSEAVQLGLGSLQQYLLDRLRAKDLDEEFEKLQKGLARDHKAGAAEANYYNNRFRSILPYDDNRVLLRDAPHPSANDYINASFIRGWNAEKAYIASQGPRPNTMDDMWWMIWQERLTHIVMLTNIMEGDKKKCEEYWPALGAERKYGAISVRCVDQQKRADFVIRTFDVKEAKEGSGRKVTHFHFVTWPDHDVPSVTSLVDFWRSVTWSYRHRRPPTVPLLVHCSAGVGRTGAFIALDLLMQQSQHSTSVNVQQTAAQLRHDRCHMIQTKAQYRLVHEALLEAYTCSECRKPGSAVDAMPELRHDTPSDVIDTEFQKLQQTKVLLKKPSHKMAEEEDNINKNRDVSVLPDDNHAVYLTYYMRGRNQYINAVYVPTFFKRRGCIMTQLPLQDTVIDFWRLIAGNDVTTVVSLEAELDQLQAGERYWPLTEGHSQRHGPFSIVLNSLASLGSHLSSYNLTLTPEGGSATNVRLLHYSGWKDTLPGERPDLLQLLNLVADQEARDPQGPPLLLQCRDGATRSGLLRVIADVISRMTSDGQVDVYTAVKHIQNVRPECVTNVEQYRFVYSVLQRHLQTSSVYQNT